MELYNYLSNEVLAGECYKGSTTHSDCNGLTAGVQTSTCEVFIRFSSFFEIVSV